MGRISGLCANRIWKNMAKFDETFIKLHARSSVDAEFLIAFRLLLKLSYTWQGTDLLNIQYSLERTTNLHYWNFFLYADFSCIRRIYSTIHVSETGTLRFNLNILVLMYNLQLWDTAPVREAQSTRNKEACNARCEASTMSCWGLWRWADGLLITRRFERAVPPSSSLIREAVTRSSQNVGNQ